MKEKTTIRMKGGFFIEKDNDNIFNINSTIYYWWWRR